MAKVMSQENWVARPASSVPIANFWPSFSTNTTCAPGLGFTPSAACAMQEGVGSAAGCCFKGCCAMLTRPAANSAGSWLEQAALLPAWLLHPPTHPPA